MEYAIAPFLTYEDVTCEARGILVDCGWDGSVPVDIEAIVEFRYGMDVVPVRGLSDDYFVDGFLTFDLTQIYVEEYIFERHPTRYRFTLAHEFGHRILHGDVFGGLDITTTDAWIEFYLGLDEQDHGWFERQAYWFAGAVLVPDEPLLAAYDSMALSKLEAQGLGTDGLSAQSKSTVAGALAKRFLVSTGVMQRRLKEVGIW